MPRHQDVFTYHVNGIVLQEPDCVRDLGVTLQPPLRFRKHVVDTARSASYLCNLILRTFVCSRLDFYLHLYKSFVIPELLYCSAVWSPHIDCEKKLLERVQTRFLKFVARRCRIDVCAIQLPSIESLDRAADIRIFNNMVVTGEASNFFRITVNNRRSRLTYDPLAVPPNDVINNIFSWRLARLLREREIPLR